MAPVRDLSLLLLFSLGRTSSAGVFTFNTIALCGGDSCSCTANELPDGCNAVSVDGFPSISLYATLSCSTFSSSVGLKVCSDNGCGNCQSLDLGSSESGSCYPFQVPLSFLSLSAKATCGQLTSLSMTLIVVASLALLVCLLVAFASGCLKCIRLALIKFIFSEEKGEDARAPLLPSGQEQLRNARLRELAAVKRRAELVEAQIRAAERDLLFRLPPIHKLDDAFPTDPLWSADDGGVARTRSDSVEGGDDARTAPTGQAATGQVWRL